MQFPVPQFTDVEDKVIGPLTVKQFVIILAAAACTFVMYSSTKDYYLTAIVGFLLGVPALILAFGQFNGRPVYASAIAMVQYWTRPKFFIFRKEMASVVFAEVKDVPQQKPQASEADAEDPRSRLKKIQYQLEQRAQQEAELLTRKK
ncbi:MAG: PrgI family protein [Candidatus Doudnabacteria bacterium]|nr:PrgI family protein [Candidatus Doudnabacteria bacterium]